MYRIIHGWLDRLQVLSVAFRFIFLLLIFLSSFDFQYITLKSVLQKRARCFDFIAFIDQVFFYRSNVFIYLIFESIKINHILMMLQRKGFVREISQFLCMLQTFSSINRQLNAIYKHNLICNFCIGKFHSININSSLKTKWCNSLAHEIQLSLRNEAEELIDLYQLYCQIHSYFTQFESNIGQYNGESRHLNIKTICFHPQC